MTRSPSSTDPVVEGYNNGPDGKHYPFGWLGTDEIRIGDFTLVPVREDRDDEDPYGYAMYRRREDGVVKRETFSWRTLPQALVAVAAMMEGLDNTAVSSVVPVLVSGFRAVGDE